MPKKYLTIVETAYRATLEEQDDPVLWLSQALRGAGADVDVLLRGNAVNYGVRGQNAAGLSFGKKVQTQPPRLDRDVESLIQKGASVYYVEGDATARGIAPGELIGGLKAVKTGQLPAVLEGYDQVWHW